MNETPAAASGGDWAEAALRRELARGDAVLAPATPMLRHLLATDRPALFSEEIVARVRGMLGDLARQLVEARAEGSDTTPEAGNDNTIDRLGASLADENALLGHLHALALEAQLAERLRARVGLDPVLNPLLQALIASDDLGTAETAMRLLAAQARFGQNQRRMQLPLGELPADVLHAVLLVLRAHTAVEATGAGLDAADAAAARAEVAIRAAYDEAATRLGLAARLVTGMGGGVLAALALGHAGLALFATALAVVSGQGRDVCMLALQEGQTARAALLLRAAGVRPGEVTANVLALDPRAQLPNGFECLSPERAAAILAGREPGPGC